MKAVIHKPFFRQIFKLILLLDTSYHYIIEVINWLYNMQDECNHWFAIYYPYYKDKFSNLTRSFIFIVDNIHFLYNLSNLLIALICNIKLGLVTKRREPLRTSLYLFSDALQIPSLILSLIPLKICLPFFKHITIFKCILIFIS